MKALAALIALFTSLAFPAVLGVPTATAAAPAAPTVAAAAATSTGVGGRLSTRRSAGNESVSTGGEHGCRLPGDGSLWCWGRNSWAQLGDGRLGTQTPSVQRVGSSTKWKRVSAGGANTCAIRKGGRLYCWGLNNFGQLGNGTDEVSRKPSRVKGERKKWSTVSAGWYTTCGITTKRKLYCWGDNGAQQLARSGLKQSSVPKRVRGGRWKSVSVGSRFVCATKTNGSLWCWGGNLWGQLGNGSYGGRAKPTRVAGGATWAEVSTSWTHTCARTTGGQAWCWGRNTWGQLGDGTQDVSATPRPVLGGHEVIDIATTEGASCLLDSDNRTWCFGNNAYGVFGDGDTPWSATPVAGPAGMREIDGGWRHVCGNDAQGNARCWGENDRAQLGNGTLTGTAAPTEVQPAPAADPTGATTFRIATANALGNIHTRPYAKDDGFAPSTTRSMWLSDAADVLGLDIVGLQETTSDQLAHILKAGRGRWQAYPAPSAGDSAVEASVMWRTSVWEPVELTTIDTQFISRKLPRPVVRLRHRVTGREIYVMNVHNAPWDYQRKRDMATKVQIQKLQELRATGLPVFFVGDMNEKRTILCKVTTQTDLVSPYGGGVDPTTGTCVNPPTRMRVDWIFGSPDAAYSGFTYTRHPLVSLFTDHHVAMVGVRLP